MTSTNPITGSNSLSDLAARIRAEHEAALLSMRLGLQHAIACGRLLLEAKEQIKFGEWLPWLHEACPFSERLAQSYMRLAKHEEELPQNSADLTIDAALHLLAKPTVAEAISDPEPGPVGQLDRNPPLEMLWRFHTELTAIDPRIVLTDGAESP